MVDKRKDWGKSKQKRVGNRENTDMGAIFTATDDDGMIWTKGSK